MGETRTRMTRLMMPMDANPHGNVHGGAIMRYVDEVAGIAAHRHARGNVVTARLDRMDFLEPVFIGNVLDLTALLAYTGKTSMEVVVDIVAENLDTGERLPTGRAWITMIAMSDRNKPRTIPPVIPHTEEERRLHEEAKARYEARKRERTR